MGLSQALRFSAGGQQGDSQPASIAAELGLSQTHTGLVDQNMTIHRQISAGRTMFKLDSGRRRLWTRCSFYWPDLD
jgi:hypothetical protein